MTAREMFEGIGYKLSEAYSEDTFISYFDGKKNVTIEFYIKNKQFKKAKGFFDCVAIKESELKAIIQQCKELGWIEEKPETNYEHYKDEIIEGWMLDLALVDGKLKRCSRVDCNECEFNPGANKGCEQRLIEWLKKPYQKPTYKLTKFEYDLLNAHKDSGMQKCLSNYRPLLELNEKGYFKDIDTKIPIREILDNCKVV